MSSLSLASYLESLLRLREMCGDEQSQSLTDESIRDEMDGAWIEMSQRERDLANRLAEALERRP
jgi:hypothetical protein